MNGENRKALADDLQPRNYFVDLFVDIRILRDVEDVPNNNAINHPVAWLIMPVDDVSAPRHRHTHARVLCLQTIERSYHYVFVQVKANLVTQPSYDLFVIFGTDKLLNIPKG